MTAKEKAKQLVDKFRNEFNWVEKDFNVDLYRDTRQCALIAVDEIIELLNRISKPEYVYFFPMPNIEEGNEGYDEINYWNEVKTEIEKL
jgi:hypothetical protein